MICCSLATAPGCARKVFVSQTYMTAVMAVSSLPAIWRSMLKPNGNMVPLGPCMCCATSCTCTVREDTTSLFRPQLELLGGQ